MSFHLRPVSDNSPSPSPTASGTPPGDRSPPFKVPSSSIGSSPSTSTKRRPLSPSSLRDVDLSHTPDMPSRKYPAPPTGHDLMAMFPPAPPDNNSPEIRGGPTSGFFQRQERAFFAQAGKEIVRVRVEVDLPHGAESDLPKSRGREPSSSRAWAGAAHTQPGPSLPHHSPAQSSSSIPPPYPNSRPPHRGPIPVTPAPLFPVASHPPPPSQMPPNLHPPAAHPASSGLQSPPQDPSQPGGPVPKPEFQGDDYDADDAWRRPMPYNERRRAGKHTRRVIVRT